MIGQRTIRVIGVLAALNGLVGATADTLLLYAPGFSDNLFGVLSLIPQGRLLAGFYLGIFLLPLYGVGYWVVYEALKPAGGWRSIPVLCIGLYGGALGTIFHAVAGLAVKIVLEQGGAASSAADGLMPYLAFIVPLFIVVHVIVVLGSIWFGIAIWDRRTPFSRWMVLLSPGVLAAALFVISLVGPPVGDFLQPTALNLAHFGFFAGATAVLWNHEPA